MNTLETRRQIILNRRQSGVAFILLDCPNKLNTLGTALMNQLNAALKSIEDTSAVKAVVMISGKPDNFIIGADLFEIRQAATQEELLKLSDDGQDTMNHIAALQVPVVVAINGTCLGGGLELALSGHWRIASDDPRTRLGLPEVKLGIIPGLGGTQRLPRLIGLKSALGLILSADPVPVREALSLGLIDEIVPASELMDRAERRALELAADRCPIADRLEQGSLTLADNADINTAATGIKATQWCLRDLNEEKAAKLFAMTERSVRIKTRGHYPAQTRVLEVMKIGLNQGIKAGLAAEAQAFSELAGGDVAANLIALFFATDFAKQSAASLAAKLCSGRTVNVGIIGGGTMGTAIAARAAAHGIDTILKVRAGREVVAVEAVRAQHPHGHHAGEDKSDGSTENGELVRCVADYHKLSDAQLVLEAVTEDTAVKIAVLKELEQAVGPDCTIASNTSSLPLGQLAKALQNSERFVGLHFFHPVDKMTLVEIVALKGSSRKALACAADFVTRLGKIPVMVKDGPGFLINRLLTCYLLEAARIAAEGVPLSWIDEAAVDFGMPMGPLEVLDEVGMDLALKIAETLHQAFGARMTPPAILNEVAKLGLVGKKTGRGIYLWDESGRRKEFNPDLLKLANLHSSSEKAPAEQRQLLSQRLIYPMIDEAARCLEDRIVMKPREIDMAIIHGIGFPPFRGGILKYADRLGLKEVAARLMELYTRSTEGDRHISKLIERYIAEGRSFYSRGSKEEE